MKRLLNRFCIPKGGNSMFSLSRSSDTSRTSFVNKAFVFLLVFALLIVGLPGRVSAVGGAYSIKFYAADPAVNDAPYLPTYEKLTPSEQPPIVGGRYDDPLPDAVAYGPTAAPSHLDAVTSIMPKNLALGQIVPFEIEIAVLGDTTPENGMITFTSGWNTHTVNGQNFGFDPAYMVYSAFVDYGDAGSVDPGSNATVDSYSDVLAGSGATEEIQGTFIVSGLDSGDNIIVEVWLVLKSTIPVTVGSNVPTRMISADTVVSGPDAPQTINVGNQTVPLLQSKDFYTEQAEVSVTKSDSPDPVFAGNNLTYTIRVANASTDTVANGIVITDTLDTNVTFVSASHGGTHLSGVVTWPALSLSPGEVILLTLVVSVDYSAPTANFTGTNPDDRGTASAASLTPAPDITNIVTLTPTITKDILTTNNVWQEPTNVLLDTVDVSVEKVWDDFEDLYDLRPDSISVELMQNGLAFVPAKTATLNDGNDWSHTFNGLPEKDTNGDDYTYTVEEVVMVPGYSTTYSSDGLVVTNTLDTVDVSVEKVWDDFDDQYDLRPDSITVQLLQNGAPFGDPFDLDEDNQWQHTFDDLPMTDMNGDDFTYTFAEISVVPGYTTTYSEDTRTITNTLDTVDIPVEKIWEDFDDQFGLRPDSISVQLLQNGMAIGDPVDLNDDNMWQHTFEDLPMTDASGDAYTYTVSEITSVPGYTTTYSEDTLTITNTLDTVNVPVEKIWDDFDDLHGLRPDSISVQLLQNGVVIGDPVDLNDGNMWQHTFMDLPETDPFNDDYVYTAEETVNVAGYTTTYSTDGLTITNTLDLTSRMVLKVWDDFDDQYGLRPDNISVQLLQNGLPFGEPLDLNEDNLWRHTFEDLPMTDAGGDPFTYTVEEISDVAGYTTTYSQDTFTITNTLDTVEVPVEKVWEDFDNQFGLRPDSITVQLLQNGSPLGDPMDLDADNMWQHTFTDLPMTDMSGDDYTYTFAEISIVHGYTTTYSEDTRTITNTLDTVDVPVEKVWEDFDNQFGLRPDSVTVQLLQNGSPFGDPMDLDADNLWQHTFTDLPMTDMSGDDFTYTFAEISVVPGYATTYSEDTRTITNTLDTVDVPVEKIWEDFDNLFSLRPDSITVQLLQNGFPFGDPMDLDADNLWQHTFTDLPMTDMSGDAFTYTFAEISSVPGYATSYSEDTRTITNTLETVDVPVEKIWVDFDDQFGLRPDSIMVQLLQNGLPFGDPIALNEGNLWQHLITDLPMTDMSGDAFAYTFAEITSVPGYTTTYSEDMLAITNTLDTVDVPVEKIWADFDNQYGLRPDSISIQLLQNGLAFGAPIDLSEGNLWQHTFENLPKTDLFGEDYTYTVSEVTAASGYTTSASEDSLTITNTLKTFFIQLIKLDQRDGETPLAGAVFELRQAVMAEGNEGAYDVGSLLATLTTDANGQATTAAAYGPGTYFLVETQAPAGFHLMDEPVLVVVSPDGESGSTVVVTVIDNFINQPSLTVSKQVSNLTTGSPAADLNDLQAGETARYHVVVTNNGNVDLTNVILTDNQVAVGTFATLSGGGTLTWQAGTAGIATLTLGNLAVGASVTLTYDYLTVAADVARSPVVNTVVATGTLQPTPDYPDGAQLSATDFAIITVQAIPLVQPGLEITKRVRNLTQGGNPSNLAVGFPGDIFQYTIQVTNTGNMDLTLIKLSDNKAVVDGAVQNVTDNKTLIWLADGTNPPYVMLDDLAPGETVTLTYTFTATVADLATVRINTAVVVATVKDTLEELNPVTLEDEDMATIITEQIPLTGESNRTTLWGALFLIVALAIWAVRRRRRNQA